MQHVWVVVRGIPTDWSEEEIFKNINVPFGCGPILKVRRLNKKQINNANTNFIPIETVVLTFDGQVLPKRVYLCYNSLPVDLYIYPTIQCFQCCRYGHIKSQCRSSPRCFKCGNGHSGDSCNIEEENVICCLCSGSHFATSRKCPEFFRQKSIKESMAKSCLSYAEALKLHPPVGRSYSDVLSTPISPPISHIKVSNPKSENVNKSYKKTVFLKPKTPVQLSKGFDKIAHAKLTNEYDIPL